MEIYGKSSSFQGFKLMLVVKGESIDFLPGEERIAGGSTWIQSTTTRLCFEAVRLFSGRLVIDSLNSCEKGNHKIKAIEAP